MSQKSITAYRSIFSGAFPCHHLHHLPRNRRLMATWTCVSDLWVFHRGPACLLQVEGMLPAYRPSCWTDVSFSYPEHPFPRSPGPTDLLSYLCRDSQPAA